MTAVAASILVLLPWGPQLLASGKAALWKAPEAPAPNLPRGTLLPFYAETNFSIFKGLQKKKGKRRKKKKIMRKEEEEEMGHQVEKYCDGMWPAQPE